MSLTSSVDLSFNEGSFKSIHSFRGGKRFIYKLEDHWCLDTDVPHWVRIIDNNKCLDIFIYLRRDSQKIAFFGQDALIEGRRDLPYFYRSKWINKLSCSFVTFNDPSLYHSSDCGAGWFGLAGSWHLLKSAIDKIIYQTATKPENVLFYGASAGGYWALTMAPYYPLSTVIVDIPQINLDTYFRGADRARYLSEFGLAEPLSTVFDYWGGAKLLPRIYYCQNIKDLFHIRTQYSYFLKRLSQIIETDVNCFSGLTVIPYTVIGALRGHAPMCEADTIDLINGICARNVHL